MNTYDYRDFNIGWHDVKCGWITVALFNIALVALSF